jgi:hypothetical protein
VPEHVWEEDELSPFLPFPLDLWRNIYTHLKNKRLISLITYFNIYIYIVIIVNYCTYKKSSASESTSVTRALSHSRLSCFLASHFDFQKHFFEGPDSSSINSTSRVVNSVSPVPSDIVKIRLWCPSFFFLDRQEQHHHRRVFPRMYHIDECPFQD